MRVVVDLRHKSNNTAESLIFTIMQRIYAIGDIHGRFDKLMALLEKIDIDFESDTVVFLGDYVDRGPNSFEVVDFLVKLKKKYPMVPIYGINKMVNSSKTVYEIDFDLESPNDMNILIQEDGEILRSEKELAFTQIPTAVLSSLEIYLDTVPVPFLINEMKEITFQDFVYYEIKGEHNQKLFVVGITGDGKRIEEKNKLITTYFSP